MSQSSRVDDPYSRIVGMDPGAGWLLGPGLQAFSPGDEALISFIIRVDDRAALDVINERLLGSGDGAQPVLDFPGLRFDVDARRGVQLGQYVSGVAPKAFFEELAREGGDLEALRVGSKHIQLGLPLRVRAAPAPSPRPDRQDRRDATRSFLTAALPPKREWPSGTVVIGIIDDGIAFAHERFRRADGASRVEAFWNQDGPPSGSSAILYGSEIDKQGIDDLLAECTTAGWTDEDRVYRRCGLIDFTSPDHKAVAWRAAHGTHVLDLAAGYSRGEDRADRPIIAVQLPVAATAGQSGAGLEPYVLRAIQFIIERARGLTADGDRPLPVVINFSYGTHAGPHDGTSLLEQAIDAVVTSEGAVSGESAPVRVVLPAGNTHGSRCHAQVAFRVPDEIVTLRLRVQPDDHTPSTVQVWLPHAGPEGPARSRISLCVTTPDGVQSAWIGEGPDERFELESDGQVHCAGSYSFVPSPTERGVFRIDLQPTIQIRPGPSDELNTKRPGVAPSGLWTMKLKNVLLAPDDKVEAWIERDDLLYGHPRRGRQSYFDEPCYLRFDAQGRPVDDDPEPLSCSVRRAGMISAIATGKQAVVIGGFVRKDLRIARYSAGGPSTPAREGEPKCDLHRPDALAVSDDSRVHTGVLAAGSRSGSVIALSGTSVAAPQITRWIADQLAAGNPSDRAAVQAFARLKEEQLPPSKPPLPPGRGGAGRIELGEPMQCARSGPRR